MGTVITLLALMSLLYAAGEYVYNEMGGNLFDAVAFVGGIIIFLLVIMSVLMVL